MRTVTGPTDRVVIVGAGLAGLAAAVRLAVAGREVTLVEREDHPGGRAGTLSIDGYTFDTGPTVLTMVDLIEDLFDCAGERMDDWLTLHPVVPAYRAHYHDGSHLDVYSDVPQMAAEIERVCGSAEARGYEKFVSFLHRLYRAEMNDFINRNHDSVFDLLTPNLARLVGMGAFTTLDRKVSSYMKHPHLQKLFSFQAMYAGMSPHRALAIYAIITYMDCVQGVYFPVGGIHALPKALAALAVKNGVTIRYGTAVSRVATHSGRATGVLTADGEHIPADVVLLNVDPSYARRTLLGQRPRRLRYSPSCFVLNVGSSANYPDAAHHNIHFGRAWRSTFRQLLDHGQLMTDPSFLITCPTKSDPALAPSGKNSYYVLFPVPNTTAELDWSRIGRQYRDEIMSVVQESGYPEFASSVEVEHTITPVDWARFGLPAGTPFTAAHSLTQTGPFRAGNIRGDNIVYAGAGTRPGVGVPMVLISGHLAAERILGHR
ncbi:phytoene desaturase family protein [Nocardia gamkensis]|uniref:Phytoene desaturase n=1 Tax=Nocardia gamkensis TaxID=352869 RepID=A0A7X6R168_9NOCA|nr:phytoene desaturase family protein [Nocardia gamkensis]NKY24970.1 phytoene desaturase [Nocardia gamkensis]NQE66753.1 Hydroxyneurosporene desaturase [Nocardia gamkensis]